MPEKSTQIRLRKILNENKRLKEENRNLMEILTNFEKIKEYLQKN